jgi:hypothetical protein
MANNIGFPFIFCANKRGGVGQYIWVAASYSPALGDMKSGWAAAGGKGAPLPAAAQHRASVRGSHRVYKDISCKNGQYIITDVYERMIRVAALFYYGIALT